MGIATRLAALDLEQARASRQEDKQMIDDQVRREEGGFPAMNRLLRSCMCEALERVKDNFEGSFAKVVAALEQQQAACSPSSRSSSSPGTVVAAASPSPQLPCLLGRLQSSVPDTGKPDQAAAYAGDLEAGEAKNS